MMCTYKLKVVQFEKYIVFETSAVLEARTTLVAGQSDQDSLRYDIPHCKCDYEAADDSSLLLYSSIVGAMILSVIVYIKFEVIIGPSWPANCCEYLSTSC